MFPQARTSLGVRRTSLVVLRVIALSPCSHKALCGEESEDNIEHLEACPAFCGFLLHERHLGVPPETVENAARWATLSGIEGDECICAAVIRNDCLVHAYNAIKTGGSDIAPDLIMKARLRQLCVRYRQVWSFVR